MARRVKEVERTTNTRQRNKLIILGVEGKNNKTEKLYFSSFVRDLKGVNFVFACNKTDPEGIVKGTIIKAQKEDIDIEYGDVAVTMFDVDADNYKSKQIKAAKDLANKSKYKVSVITSNPCFEIWYLEHFKFSTKEFISSQNVKKEMCSIIKDYKESGDYYSLLKPLTKDAISNCEKLKKYNTKNHSDIEEEYWNPSTNVYLFVKKLLNYQI